MEIKEDEYLLVFSSHNQAAFLYNKLVQRGLKVNLVSTPCKISEGCTQSIKFKKEDMEFIVDLAKKYTLALKAIYKINNLKYSPKYELYKSLM